MYWTWPRARCLRATTYGPQVASSTSRLAGLGNCASATLALPDLPITMHTTCAQAMLPLLQVPIRKVYLRSRRFSLGKRSCARFYSSSMGDYGPLWDKARAQKEEEGRGADKDEQRETGTESREAPQTGSQQQVSDLEGALSEEAQRATAKEHSDFHDAATRELKRVEPDAFSRTLGKGNFFTPHVRPTDSQPSHDPVRREYAAVMDSGVVVLLDSPPSWIKRGQLPEIPEALRSRMRELEHANWQLVGGSPSMPIVERLVNPQQDGQDYVHRVTRLFVLGVTCLTLLIYVGDYLYVWYYTR